MAENIIMDKVVGESGASNSNVIDQSQTVDFKGKKERKKRSRVWDHFTYKIDSDENAKVVCKYCKKEYCADTKTQGTSTMLGHIPKCTKMPYNIETKQAKLAFQPVTGGNKGDVAIIPWISNEDCALAEMATKMKDKFEKYWGSPEKMNKMLFISCVLDPRHKFKSLSFALKKIFGDKAATIESDVRTYMESLFYEYKPALNDKEGQLSSVEVEASGSDSVSIGDFGNFFEELHWYTSGSRSANYMSELDKYLEEDIEIEKADFDVLLWWKVNSPRFAFLFEMARDVLAISISSVASECAFSMRGRILDSFRSSLTPKLVQALVCLQDWLRSEPQPINIEEDLDFLEQLEQGFIMPRRPHNKTPFVWLHYVKLEDNGMYAIRISSEEENCHGERLFRCC